MTTLTIPSIFWTTIVAMIVILLLATVIGRKLGKLFPFHLRGAARFYLAPVLGLAALTIIASVVGRILPLGNSFVVPCLVIALLFWAFYRECHIKQALRHILMVNVFGIICGVSVLGPLFLYGAFNAHNDAFTYLVHSNWLQHHAFKENISSEMMTLSDVHVFVYQIGGFRMGASFLLAFLQSLFHLQWSYEVYPAVIISAITACCLAIGFPLTQVLCTMPRYIRLALLALPACSLGGLIFGANLGFLPQTVGLAFGSGLLFAFGPMLRYISILGESRWKIAKAMIPIALLFAAAIFAYSEIAPFLLVAVVGSAFFHALRYRMWRRVLSYTGVMLVFSILLLNTELLRACIALQTQSSAIVVGPVNWPLFGFVAHSFGIHGGVWDGFQWSLPERSGLLAIGITLSFIIGAVIVLGRRPIWNTILNGVLMPTGILLVILCAGLIYFRYFVQSPFPTGIGQSWNQFKLSEWAHPFVMVFILLAIASFQPRFKKLFNGAVLILFAIGVLSATVMGVLRARHLIQYYGGTSDLNCFYQKFRQMVLSTCPRDTRIYLALNDPSHQNFRRMLVYYIPEREMVSDWTNECFVFPWLIIKLKSQILNVGDCVIEPIGQGGLLSQGTTLGPFRIGIFDGKQGRIQIASIKGAYDRESDGNNWWHWVECKINFQLQPLSIPKNSNQTKLHFEYTTRGKQTLTLQIIKRDGSTQKILLQSKGDTEAVFDDIVNVSPNEITGVSIETDGKASPLNDRDPRMATFRVGNVTITPL